MVEALQLKRYPFSVERKRSHNIIFIFSVDISHYKHKSQVLQISFERSTDTYTFFNRSLTLINAFPNLFSPHSAM